MPARHVLDFLELEHLAHGGAENGRLAAPYNQLVAFGISRRDIRPALDELEEFGIIRTQRGERQGGRSQRSKYALTFYPATGAKFPTFDYKHVGLDQVKEFKAARKRSSDWRKSPTLFLP